MNGFESEHGDTNQLPRALNQKSTLGWRTKNADLAVQISPESTLVLPAMVTLKGDVVSSHLGGNKAN
jgi:hypothetical protein